MKSYEQCVGDYQAAAAFSWMLRSNSSLSEMDLSCNALGPAGGAELLAALQHNTCAAELRILHVAWTVVHVFLLLLPDHSQGVGPLGSGSLAGRQRGSGGNCV